MSKETMYSELIDKDFVFELAKRGKVSLTSSQIIVEGNQLDLAGIVIPPRTFLEFMYSKPGKFEGDDVARLRFVVR